MFKFNLYKRFLSENSYLFLGILLGFYLSTILSPSTDSNCIEETIKNESAQEILNASVNNLAPKITKKKPQGEKKSKLIRPRYYSTELGIREKLFIGIFTSEEKINTQAIHINKTIGHLVDKIKFFITAQYKLKTKFNLTGLVGFTDAREKYRPFQVIKYIDDTFGQDYDYYFFANDYTFINGYKLKDLVNNVSVSMDVYLGTKVMDGSFCNLDAGIILSNSVLKAMRLHLDWCIMNAVANDHSENIGRCIYHSLGLSCQESIKSVRMPTFKLKHFELSKHLLELTHKEEFREAVTIYPVLQKEDFYMLNAYFLKEILVINHEIIKEFSNDLTENWPPGQKTPAKPATRFDLPKQYYFNVTHMFFPDDFTNIRKLTEPESIDIENIIEEIKAKMTYKYPRDLRYRRLVNGYRTFDLSRGMDYIVDVGFRDLHTGREVIKRFEVTKPLGSVEFIPVPYVTENSRVTIILPLQENEIIYGSEFLNSYVAHIMDRKEKTFLMLVFLYQYNTESRGASDVFGPIKNDVTKIGTKYKNDDTRIAWVSIRLPESKVPIFVEEYNVLNFAIIDLALKKIGLESLVLMLDVYCDITPDFLNRVRMNTISNFQIFNPIPFRQYNPKFSGVENLEVSKNSGHFDREQYKYISFYGRDYVIARKKYQNVVPLMRVDNDISKILDDDHKTIGNIFEMFLKHNTNLHCMRATEMNLKVKYHDEFNRKNMFLGNTGQLAKLLLTKEDEIWEVK